MNTGTQWQTTKANIFWGEIAPCDHVVQIYETDDIFIDALSGFVSGGISDKDCVIVIATAEHIEALNAHLATSGLQIASLIEQEQYIPLDAQELLDKFMVDGWPDETLFLEVVLSLIGPALRKKQKIRAFGEMVAVLWAQGHNGATVQLEHLWNEFCKKTAFCLFCAYPQSGFTNDIHDSITHICNSHSKMISGSQKQSPEISYMDMKRTV